MISTKENLNLMINNIEINSVNAQKHLGITIDSTMSWDQQISVVCLNVSRKITLMKLLSKYVNQESLKQYYYILPILDYGCIVWGQTSSHNRTRLIKLQKPAARLILKVDILTPSDELFKELNWLKFPKKKSSVSHRSNGIQSFVRASPHLCNVNDLLCVRTSCKANTISNIRDTVFP